MFHGRRRGRPRHRRHSEDRRRTESAPGSQVEAGSAEESDDVFLTPPTRGLNDVPQRLVGDPDDRALMKAAATSDDREAFHELVRRCSPTIYARARPLVDDAYLDDVIQETFARAWKYRRSYRAEAAPLTWLTSIMRNVAKNPSVRPSETLLGYDLIGLEGVESVDDIDTFVRVQAIRDALAKLDPAERELIRRKHLLNQSWDTVADQMGYGSAYFAKKAYASAKATLAQHLDISPSG